MAKLKDYLVVSELDATGYIVGNYDTIEQAREVSEDLLNSYERLHKGNGQELFERTMQCQTYEVNPSLEHHLIQNATECSSNGIYSVAIICTDRDGFSLEQLILDREGTIYIFDVEDYDQDTTKHFVKFHPDFIAN